MTVRHDAFNLHRELQRGKDVLYFRLENLWSQFAFSNPHLVGEEHYLQEDGKNTIGNPLINTIKARG